MRGITTHVLDTAKGCPASGIEVILNKKTRAGKWQELGRAKTNSDGRIGELMTEALEQTEYQLVFYTKAYHGGKSFFPEVTITFEIEDPGCHYHVPILLSPYGYSTYRGS